MRKWLWIMLILSLMLLAACNSGDDEAKEENDDGEQTEENGENTGDNSSSENSSDNDQEADEEENAADNDNDDADDESEGEEADAAPANPEYEVNKDTWAIEPIDDANEDIVLLTIDDAPDGHALEMAETMQDLDVNAIFFVNGHFLETDEEKETLQKIHDMGFLIGNHTYSHAYLPDISEDEQREEIIEVSDMVEDIIGERPAFFRAPNGANTDVSRQVAEEEDMVLMNWSYGYDFKEEYMSREAITDIMLNTELLGPGANLLMHDREWTNAALEDIITGLQDQGYEMVDPKLIKTIKNQ